MLTLVTGGSGFIGWHLVEALLARGERVRVLDVRAPHAQPSGVEFMEGSVTDRDAVAKAVKDARFVFHTAAMAHIWARDKRLYQDVNRLGTRIVLDACRKAQIERVVHTSSLTVLVGKQSIKLPVTVNEDTVLEESDMLGPYCVSKLQAEAEVTRAVAQGLSVVTVIPTLPIGPGDYGLTAPSKMILDLISGRIPAYLECILNLIDVRDLALGHILARDKGRDGERYILGHENMSLSKLLSVIHDITGLDMPKHQVPYPLARAAATINELISDYITRRPPKAPVTGVRLAGRLVWFDSSKAVKQLGLAQRPIIASVEDEIRWLAQEGLAELPKPMQSHAGD